MANLSDGAVRMLRRVKRMALQEPKRMAMPEWLVKGSRDDWEMIHWHTRWKRPRCGTVGCIGGWVEELDRLDRKTTDDWDHRMAAEILGIGRGQSSELFFDFDAIEGEPQTAEHARGVAKHIERFIRKYRGRVRR